MGQKSPNTKRALVSNETQCTEWKGTTKYPSILFLSSVCPSAAATGVCMRQKRTSIVLKNYIHMKVYCSCRTCAHQRRRLESAWVQRSDLSDTQDAGDVALPVQGLGFKVQGLEFRVQGLGFRVQGLGFRSVHWNRRDAGDVALPVQGLGFKVQGLEFRVQGLGFMVQGLGLFIGTDETRVMLRYLFRV